MPDVQFYNREIETNEKVQNNSSIDNKRDRIIQDLLNTEMSYLKEMTNWEEVEWNYYNLTIISVVLILVYKNVKA